MICSNCHKKVEVCENCFNELTDLDDDFYCYGKTHFCSESCWKVFLLTKERAKLKEAFDEEEK